MRLDDLRRIVQQEIEADRYGPDRDRISDIITRFLVAGCMDQEVARNLRWAIYGEQYEVPGEVDKEEE